MEPFEAFLSKVDEVEVPSGQIEGEGIYGLFSHTDNAFARLVNRLLKKGRAVFWAPNGFSAEGESFPVGTLMVHLDEGEIALQQLLEDIPLKIQLV